MKWFLLMLTFISRYSVKQNVGRLNLVDWLSAAKFAKVFSHQCFVL